MCSTSHCLSSLHNILGVSIIPSYKRLVACCPTLLFTYCKLYLIEHHHLQFVWKCWVKSVQNFDWFLIRILLKALKGPEFLGEKNIQTVLSYIGWCYFHGLPENHASSVPEWLTLYSELAGNHVSFIPHWMTLCAGPSFFLRATVGPKLVNFVQLYSWLVR